MLRRIVLELLKHRQRSLRILGLVQPSVDDSQLIPGLLDYLGIRIRGNRLLELFGGGRVISKAHLCPAQIVGGIFQSRALAQGGFDRGLALAGIAGLHLERS